MDWFIFGELIGPFFFGLMAFTIIMVAGGLLFKIADLVIKNGVSLGIVIRLFLYYLPRMAATAIPMSCLLAALLGFISSLPILNLLHSSLPGYHLQG